MNKKISKKDTDQTSIDSDVEDILDAEFVDEKSPTEIAEKLKKSVKFKAIMTRSFRRSGPLPSPEEIQKYAQIEKVGTNLVDRIVSMAEKEQDHRHEINHVEIVQNKTELEGKIHLQKRGQSFAFVLVFTMVVGGIVLAVFSQDTLIKYAGVITVIATGILSVAKTFLNHPKAEKSELPSDPEPPKE
jgi:uncharacterized membrane protein